MKTKNKITKKENHMQKDFKINPNLIYFEKLEPSFDTRYYGMYDDWDEFAIETGNKFKKAVGLDIYIRNTDETSDNNGIRVGRIVGDIYLVESMINKYKYPVSEVYFECDKYNSISVDAISCLLSEEDGLWTTEYYDCTNRNFMVIYGFYIEDEFRNKKIATVVLDNLKKVLSLYYNVNVSWLFYYGAYIKKWDYSKELDWYCNRKLEYSFEDKDFDNTKKILTNLGFQYFNLGFNYKYEPLLLDEDELEDGIYYRILTDDIYGKHYFDYIFSKNEMATLKFIIEKYEQLNRDWIYNEIALTTRLDAVVISNLKEYMAGLKEVDKVELSLSGYELYRLTEYIELIVEKIKGKGKNKDKNKDVIKLCINMQEKLNKNKNYFTYFKYVMIDFECRTIYDTYLYNLYYKKVKNYIQIIHSLRSVYFEKGQI